MNDSGLREQVIELARALIRLDTSNPPGNETPAAELLAEYLGAAGVEAELVGPDPKRLNLVARIAGAGEGPSLMLMAHTDVVPAPTDGWSVDPFEGAVRDGRLIGRGATDMKNELAARAVAFAALARGEARPAGDVVLVAEADEERNTAGVGMSWLVRERPDLRCDYALNEGGGTLLELADGRRVVTVSIGEKRVTSLRLRLFGTAGHASVPAGADNPLRHAATAIQRLLDHPSPARMAPSVARALSALGAPDGSDEELIAWAGAQHPVLADLLPAMVRMTVTPTGAQTFEPANVIPPYADVICDCRALPGQSESEIRDHVAAALGDGLAYELELLEPLEGGTESTVDTPLYRVLEDYVAERLPGARLLPLISTGFTDSHWVRAQFDTVAYGFAPQFHGDPIAYLKAAHATDEALELDDLAEMAEFHLRALTALPAAPPRRSGAQL
jgi:acetylornithine deacetylase/succinyl-diaminopimelate desuccinylase-like protein